MCEAIPPLLNTLSWRGAQLKNTTTTLPLPSRELAAPEDDNFNNQKVSCG